MGGRGNRWKECLGFFFGFFLGEVRVGEGREIFYLEEMDKG